MPNSEDFNCNFLSSIPSSEKTKQIKIRKNKIEIWKSLHKSWDANEGYGVGKYVENTSFHAPNICSFECLYQQGLTDIQAIDTLFYLLFTVFPTYSCQQGKTEGFKHDGR